MTIENPYRSVASTEGTRPKKPSRFSISRVVIIVVLLLFTGVTFFIHEAYGGGTDGVDNNLGIAKIGLNRLRGQVVDAVRSLDKSKDKGARSIKGERGDEGSSMSTQRSVADGGSHIVKEGLDKGSPSRKDGGEEASKKVPPVPSVDHDTVQHAGNELNSKQHIHNTIHKLDTGAKLAEVAMKAREMKVRAEEALKHSKESVKPVVTDKRGASNHAQHEIKIIEKMNPGAEQAVAPPKVVTNSEGGAAAHLDQAPAGVARAARNRQQFQQKGIVNPSVAIPKAKAKPQQMNEGKRKGEVPVLPVVSADGPKPHNVPPAARPPNPYDPPASVKRVIAEKRAKREMLELEAMEHLKCDGSVDPFANLPVESWTPPQGALLKDKMTWKRHMQDMLHKIKAQKVGGKELRKIIDEEVDKLKLERVAMFCEAFLKERGDKKA